MGKKGKNESKLRRCIKAPFRILSRAKDMYIKSMTDCAGKVSYGTAMGCPTGQVTTLPKSFSVNSSRLGEDDDLRELIRAASQRGLRDKIEMEIRQQQLRQSAAKSDVLPRSFTVGIGRIDEEKPCDFDEDLKVKNDLLYPRSRSYAVSKRTAMLP